MEESLTFPEDFVFGTATSAHQVEGGNDKNDWWEFEQVEGNILNGDKSGRAADQYNLYKEDIELLGQQGFQAHRISIEWSRIFPSAEEVNEEAIEHYKDVLKTIRATGQKSFVTLHHFTTPQWFMKLGGFEKKENLSYWREWVARAAEEFSDLTDSFCTVNEPLIYATLGYMKGWHSPGKTSLRSALRVADNMIRAHFIATHEIRRHNENVPVGIVKNLMDFQPVRRWSPIDQLIRYLSELTFQGGFFKAFRKNRTPVLRKKVKEGDPGDFLGINYYVPQYCGLGVPGLTDSVNPRHKDVELTQMGWPIHPDGLYKLLVKAHRHVKLPIYITENGIATLDDSRRIKYIQDHLIRVHRAMEEGVDVRGYFYWSAFDNFEWQEGFMPRFGLIEIDYDSLERRPRESFYYYAKIAQTKRLDLERN